MAEWLYEAGIGEARAALVDDGCIVEARIEVDDGAPRLGAVLVARLADARGRIAVANGAELQLDCVPTGIAEGAALNVAVTREPIPERDRRKRARAAVIDETPRAAPDLLTRVEASGIGVRRCHAHEPDRLEAVGWSELIEEARTGEIAFAGGALRMSPTPAMTLFDVDGDGDLAALAVAAARAIGAAVRRHGIGGSIGIDFPTLGDKAARQAAAIALDAALAGTGPFERTAVNGFGFLQLVRPRPRASLPELLRADPAGVAARAWLRQAEREPPGASVSVPAGLAIAPAWLSELARRRGHPISPA